MSTGRNSFPVLPTLLLSLFLGAVLGVLLLLLFRGPKTDTVSGVNSGVAGTTVTQSGGTQSGSTQSGSATSKTVVINSASTTGDTSTSQSGTQADGASLSQTVDGTKFSGNGAELYVQACQACHQAGGVGARGAGVYPALANNPKLSAAAYPLTLVLLGNGGMPGFGHYLTDEQVADVVNYIRSDLNKNTDQVTPEDVKKLRPSNPDYIIFGESAG